MCQTVTLKNLWIKITISQTLRLKYNSMQRTKNILNWDTYTQQPAEKDKHKSNYDTEMQ